MRAEDEFPPVDDVPSASDKGACSLPAFRSYRHICFIYVPAHCCSLSAATAIVEETLTALREEVKEMDRTAWLYDQPSDPRIATRMKL